MQFIDYAETTGGTSITLFKAADAGRATPAGTFRDSTLTRLFFPVPDAGSALDHGVEALSAFLNRNIPDFARPTTRAWPEAFWSGPTGCTGKTAHFTRSPCGVQIPDCNT